MHFAKPDKPLISVVIPTYEMKGYGLNFLKRCLNSITIQQGINMQSIEVVVSDQSNNEKIQCYCLNSNHSLNLKYQRTKTGKGIAAHNLNAGIAYATGQYIKILFQDDLLVEDDYFVNLADLIRQKKPDVILTGALHTTDGEIFINPIVPQNNPYFLFGNNTVSSPSVITIKRNTALKMPFDEHLKMLFDCELYYRLFNSNLSISIAKHIHIANGIWTGQSQHQIDQKQFAKEVRYLNWKFPQAELKKLLPAYKVEFTNLHPKAQLPFSEDFRLSWLSKVRYRYFTKISQHTIRFP